MDHGERGEGIGFESKGSRHVYLIHLSLFFFFFLLGLICVLVWTGESEESMKRKMEEEAISAAAKKANRELQQARVEKFSEERKQLRLQLRQVHKISLITFKSLTTISNILLAQSNGRQKQ